MRTTILAYAIAFMGLIMIGGGVWGLFFLLVGTAVRPPLRYYAMTIGMISGGLARVGLAQALRLLVAISGHGWCRALGCTVILVLAHHGRLDTSRRSKFEVPSLDLRQRMRYASTA